MYKTLQVTKGLHVKVVLIQVDWAKYAAVDQNKTQFVFNFLRVVKYVFLHQLSDNIKC